MNQSGRILHQVERNRAYARSVRSDRASQAIHLTSSANRPSSSGGVSSGWATSGGAADANQRPESAMSLCEIGVPLKVSEPHTLGGSRNDSHNFPDGTQGFELQAPTSAPTRVLSAGSHTSSAPPHIGSRRPPSPYRRMTTPASIISNQNDMAATDDDEAAAAAQQQQRRTIAQLYQRLATLENHIQQMQIQKRVLVAQNRKYRAQQVAAAATAGMYSTEERHQLRGESESPPPPPAGMVEMVEGSVANEGREGGVDDDAAAAAELMLLRAATGSPVFAGEGQNRDFPEEGEQPNWGSDQDQDHQLAGTRQFRVDSTLPEDAEEGRGTPLDDYSEVVDIAAQVHAGGGTGSDISAHAAVGAHKVVPPRPSSAGSLLDLSERQSCASAQQAAGEQLEKERRLIEQCLGEVASNKFAFAVEVRCEEDLKDLLLLACTRLSKHQQRGSRPSSPLLGGSSSVVTAPTQGGSASSPTAHKVVAFETEPSSHEDSQHQWTMSSSQHPHVLAHHRPSVSMKHMLDELKDAAELWKDAAATRLDSGLQLSLTMLQQLRVWASSCESLVERVEKTKDLVLGHAGERPADSTEAAITPPPLTISNLGAELDQLLTIILQLSRHSAVAIDIVEKNYVRIQKTVAACHDGQKDQADENLDGSDRRAGGGGSVPLRARGSLSGSTLLRGSKSTRSGSVWAAVAADGVGSSSHHHSKDAAALSAAAVRAGSAEQRVMNDIYPNVAQLREDVKALQAHCKTQLNRTLKNSATDEDLLCVYRREIADAALRCAAPAHGGVEPVKHTASPRHASGGRRRHNPPALGELADDSITVPTTPVNSSSPPPLLQPQSRPGSGTAARPRSTPGRGGGATASRSGSPLSSFPPLPPPPAIPSIITHLIRCVNTTHIAYLELFFGPVDNRSAFRSLAQQEQDALIRQQRQRDVDAALASVDGGAPAAATASSTTLNGAVLVRRSANITHASGSEMSGSGDPAIHDIVNRHIEVLPGTYGALLDRNIGEIRGLPTTLSDQDEADIAMHADAVQQLLEVGLMWSDALTGGGGEGGGAHIRVHHCTDFLELVRRSKPMVSAYFFHNAKLKATAVTELQENSSACFADALRGVLGRGGGKKGGGADQQHQRRAAQNIVACSRLLQDASRARAILNWRGLLTLHKHARMKRLLLIALKTAAAAAGTTNTPSRAAAAVPHSVDEHNEELAGNLRRLVGAFYAELGIKLEAEQRLLKSSLRITVEAVWADLLSLLRDSGDLCLASGVNIEVLDVLGPSYHTLVTEGLKFIACPPQQNTSLLTGASIVIPRGRSDRVSASPLRGVAAGGGGRTSTPIVADGNLSALATDVESVHDDTASQVSHLFPPRPSSPTGGLAGHSTTSFDVGAAPAWLGLCISKSATPSSTQPRHDNRRLPPTNRLATPGDGRLRPLRPQSITHSAHSAQQQHHHKPATSPQRSNLFTLAPSPHDQRAAATTVPSLGKKLYTTSAVLSQENPWLAWKSKPPPHGK